MTVTDLDFSMLLERVDALEEALVKPVRMKIACTKCPESIWEGTVPKYICDGVMIQFHASHEGHELRATIDGVEYQIP